MNLFLPVVGIILLIISVSMFFRGGYGDPVPTPQSLRNELILTVALAVAGVVCLLPETIKLFTW
jgi:high-affinity K+ transport system ATPase subunit B